MNVCSFVSSFGNLLKNMVRLSRILSQLQREYPSKEEFIRFLEEPPNALLQALDQILQENSKGEVDLQKGGKGEEANYQVFVLSRPLDRTLDDPHSDVVVNWDGTLILAWYLDRGNIRRGLEYSPRFLMKD